MADVVAAAAAAEVIGVTVGVGADAADDNYRQFQ